MTYMYHVYLRIINFHVVLHSQGSLAGRQARSEFQFWMRGGRGNSKISWLCNKSRTTLRKYFGCRWQLGGKRPFWWCSADKDEKFRKAAGDFFFFFFLKISSFVLFTTVVILPHFYSPSLWTIGLLFHAGVSCAIIVTDSATLRTTCRNNATDSSCR